MRDREQLFSDFIGELRKKEKEEKTATREKVHCSFKIALVIEFSTRLFVYCIHPLNL